MNAACTNTDGCSIVFVTLGTLVMEPHVLMQALAAGTVIVTPMPVAREPMVLNYVHVIMVSLETVLPVT